jgi:N-acetylglucosamine-6-phosphate deacetylase
VKAIINGKIITETEVFSEKIVLFEDKIIDIINKEEISRYSNVEIINAEGKYVSPGFIDIHIHGSGGCDTMDGTLEALETMSKTVAQNGTTGFLATTMTMSREDIHRAFDRIKEAMEKEMPGASVLGAHMEGPFINEKYKGAQNPGHIVEPSLEFIRDYLDIIKLITLAPEKDHNHDFIDSMREHSGITLSIGHSNATYAQAMEAIKKGIRHATHTFNAMTPLNHREPGIVGAIFGSDVSCELIADTIHVHPGIFQILNDIKGKGKIVLVTDSMRAGCMKDGSYDLGGQRVIVKDKSARLEDGTLAGSVLTLNKAAKNMLDNTNLEIHEVVSMVSLNPAKVIGMDVSKGSIAVGKDADIILLNADFEIFHTIRKGKTVFTK